MVHFLGSQPARGVFKGKGIIILYTPYVSFKVTTANPPFRTAYIHLYVYNAYVHATCICLRQTG